MDCGKLFVKQFDAKELSDLLYEKNRCNNNMTLVDCSVYVYAKTNSLRLLTGDRKLRSYADRNNTTVSGILFLFDRIVEECVISKAEAIDKLSLLKEMNIRLPESAITERLGRWAE